MDATTVGLDANSLVLGKHSGRAALKQTLAELGFTVEGAALNAAFKRFKQIADKKKQVTAMDLEALVTDDLRDELASYTLDSFDGRGRLGPPAARATSRSRCPTARSPTAEFSGDGPIDSVFAAINAATGIDAQLRVLPRRRRHRRAGRARRDVGRARVRGPVGLRPGRRDRHHRGGRDRLRARAVERRAQGAGGVAARRRRAPTSRSPTP